MHRNEKRCHKKYDETNAHHPHMHDNHPFFNTISDYSENALRITAKKRGPLSPLVRRSQNGIASLLFHTKHENKLQIRGRFYPSLERGVISPQPPRDPP